MRLFCFFKIMSVKNDDFEGGVMTLPWFGVLSAPFSVSNMFLSQSNGFSLS